METRHRAAGIMAESITYRQSPAANPLSRRRVPATLICPKATEPPSGTLRMGQPTTPAGGPEHPMPLVSIHPAFRCSIQGRVRFPGRFQDSAVKCSMRPRIYCSPTAALVHAELQQEGSPGHQSAIPPIRVSFRGAGRKSSAVDGETWSLSRCHLVGFRVSGNPIIISRATHLV